MKTVTLAASITLILSACVSAPPLKQAPPVVSQYISASVSSELPDSKEKYGTDITGTYFSSSGASGSLTVGVLFGAIGAAANAAYVTKENRSRAEPLTKLTSVNLSEYLRRDFHDEVAAKEGYLLIPSASLYFSTKTTYFLTCNVTAKSKSMNWEARYTVTVDGKFESTKNEDTASAISKVEACIHDAGQLFSEHASGKLGPFEKRTITSPRLDGKGDTSLTYSVAVSALPDRIIVNDFLGLTQLRKSEIKNIQLAPN